ncbi:hypothetical protein J0S82_001287 [Galemys pyrenaicus]|uniref:Uncharacterized protein n=1 Tax=Galemys pyrenaicus TaxID=202257 RepID=A0A8J6DWA2_GALPY|nr:hypothetical protein J0S82_001287 [Galemys pyrenaicus]
MFQRSEIPWGPEAGSVEELTDEEMAALSKEELVWHLQQEEVAHHGCFGAARPPHLGGRPGLPLSPPPNHLHPRAACQAQTEAVPHTAFTTPPPQDFVETPRTQKAPADSEKHLPSPKAFLGEIADASEGIQAQTPVRPQWSQLC